MRRAYVVLVGSFLAAVAGAVTLAAQQPRFVNARLTVQPAGAPFVQSFQKLVSGQTEPAWIGYTVPVVRGDRVMCCFTSGSSFISGSVSMSGSSDWYPAVCGLEPGASDRSAAKSSPVQGPIKLEGSNRMSVLIRVSEKRVERIRTFSEECELDAGGRPVVWLENVRPADSLALLETLVDSDAAAADRGGKRIASGALSAIAMHAEPAAGALLERLARTHSSTSVRGDAIFWMAQRAGEKVGAAITERIDNDPDTEVKKRAVFALSQLPKDEGVPLLIKIARSHANLAVRKQAIFWLGQSKDPRAIDFFAEILK